MCDTLVSITEDGVLFAKNSDRDPNEAQYLDWIPAARHAPGERVRTTWIEIPQRAETRAVLLSRPWWIFGAEMGANDAGVVIGNEAVFTKRQERTPGLLGMDLVRLALERAGSADDAVEVIVELLEAHGQGGPASFEHRSFSYDNSFLIADPDGAVVLETAGRRWASARVTGRSASISNALTLPGFASAHSDPVRSRVASAARRRADTGAAASTAGDPLALAMALRSHGPSPAPRYRLLNGAMSGPCVHAGGLATSTQTTASWISDLRHGRPRHWATASAAPCTSIFKPVSIHEPVDLGPTPTNVADDATLWWRHERLHRRTLRDPNTLLARYSHERDRTERSWFEDPPGTAEAVAVADELERRWLEDVLAGQSADRRPHFVRSLWGARDAVAGLS